MAKIIAVIILFILLVGCALWQNIYINTTAAELINDLEDLRLALNEDDDQKIIKKADSFVEKWKDRQHTYEALFEHEEVDMISATIMSIQSFCITGDKPHALAEIASTIYYFNHLIEIDSIRWENLF